MKTYLTLYVYVNGKVAYEKRGDKQLYLWYDSYGNLAALRYFQNANDETGVLVYATTNAQGDVVGLYTGSGTQCVWYEYDAWGNLVDMTDLSGVGIGTINPIRYRGYYYDTETGLYYCNSRYYDSEIGRFINADGYVSTGQGVSGHNMFVYCLSNPVMRMDSTGEIGFWAIVGIIGLAGLILSIPSSADQSIIERKEAGKKFNEDTVNVFHRNDGSVPEDNKLNAEFYVADEEKNHVNISIEDSLSVKTSAEMDAVLDVIMDSDYYSESQFGDKNYMRAQWIAHNVSYAVAQSGDLGFGIMQRLSGSDDPIESSESLDIRSKENMLLRQKILYTVISWVA